MTGITADDVASGQARFKEKPFSEFNMLCRDFLLFDNLLGSWNGLKEPARGIPERIR
jgi:hypothetical protein